MRALRHYRAMEFDESLLNWSKQVEKMRKGKRLRNSKDDRRFLFMSSNRPPVSSNPYSPYADLDNRQGCIIVSQAASRNP